MVEFGEQLRRAREAKGMTQQSLAEQLYVTRQSVSRWECGDRYPDLLTTRKISQILEVSLDDLLSGKEMTKVVERNPVVENKVGNSIIILLYAAVVLSYLIAAVSLWGIFQALYSLGISIFIAKQHIELIDQLFSVEYYSIKAVLVISIYVLVLYQTYTLYKKRVAAAEVAQVAVDAN